MDFRTLAEQRQSDRKFDTEKRVEPEKIDRILEAARLAPSACNAQPWHLVVVDDPDTCHATADAIASMGMNKFAFQAPLHIVIVEERPNFTSWFGGIVKNKHFPLIDTGIIASYITLAAASEGLGSCILGWFDEKKLKNALGIPSSRRVLLDIAIGYPIGEHRNKVRKKIDEISSRNKY